MTTFKVFDGETGTLFARVKAADERAALLIAFKRWGTNLYVRRAY